MQNIPFVFMLFACVMDTFSSTFWTHRQFKLHSNETIKRVLLHSPGSITTLKAPPKPNAYFFLRVKKDRRLGSSFCEEAGNVCDRLSAPVWSHWAFNEPTHCCISESSCDCNKNSPPFDSLKEETVRGDTGRCWCLNLLDSEHMLLLSVVAGDFNCGALQFEGWFTAECLVWRTLCCLLIFVEWNATESWNNINLKSGSFNRRTAGGEFTLILPCPMIGLTPSL